jgi:hypothetical protein
MSQRDTPGRERVAELLADLAPEVLAVRDEGTGGWRLVLVVGSEPPDQQTFGGAADDLHGRLTEALDADLAAAVLTAMRSEVPRPTAASCGSGQTLKRNSTTSRSAMTILMESRVQLNDVPTCHDVALTRLARRAIKEATFLEYLASSRALDRADVPFDSVTVAMLTTRLQRVLSPNTRRKHAINLRACLGLPFPAPSPSGGTTKFLASLN